MSHHTAGPLAEATFITADADRDAVLRFRTDVALDQPAGLVVAATVQATSSAKPGAA